MVCFFQVAVVDVSSKQTVRILMDSITALVASLCFRRYEFCQLEISSDEKIFTNFEIFKPSSALNRKIISRC
ncbi:hypothetical protein POTOM_020685 [Populus tomentosa]|uniref:Uncharacterized protein n=1 Tax=Populus tomentosa TaxID=118781 RepID=A0A8X8D0R2_POPTO|nr:hypothetical protein POTOM_020685 [Populus tomentosa]